MKNKQSKTFRFKEIKATFHSEEPWTNMFIFSYITIPLVYLMVNFTRITPNIISLWSFLFGIVSAVLFFNGFVVYGALVYTISYILDATDGKVARLTKTCKVYGAWFDIFVDRSNLTLITSSIAYNCYIQTGNIDLLFLNSLFLGLTFIGFESRYNITIYELKNNMISKDSNLKISKYAKWCKKYGVIKEPISLVELFLFYMIIAPIFGWELFAVWISIIMLIVRIIKQQKFWVDVNKI